MILTETQPYTAQLLVQSGEDAADFKLMSMKNVLFVSYSCGTCGRHFTQHSPLQVHLRLHREEASHNDEIADATLLKESKYLQNICVGVNAFTRPSSSGTIGPMKSPCDSDTEGSEGMTTVSIGEKRVQVVNKENPSTDGGNTKPQVIGVIKNHRNESGGATKEGQHGRLERATPTDKGDKIKQIEGSRTMIKKQKSQSVEAFRKEQETRKQVTEADGKKENLSVSVQSDDDSDDTTDHPYAEINPDEHPEKITAPVNICDDPEDETSAAVVALCQISDIRASMPSSHSDVVSTTGDVDNSKTKPCSICGKSFRTQSQLSRHFVSHTCTAEQRFQCTQCERSYKAKSDLTKHEKSKHSAEAIPVMQQRKKGSHICNICGDGFVTSNRLVRHQTTHSTERPFKCAPCGKAYKRKGELTNHLKEHSMKSLPFECEECGRTFGAKRYLTRHMTRRHGTKTQKTQILKYKCQYCDKTFKNKNSYEIHERIHTGERPFQCTKCDKRFANLHTLNKIHMKFHTREKPHECPICGKCFAQKGYFNYHVKSHSGKATCQCSLCGQLFKWAVSLKSHMRIHTGEMPYTCKYCGQSFRAVGGLQDHTRRHTGEKPYLCGVCGKSFISSSKLGKHRKIHAKQNVNMPNEIVIYTSSSPNNEIVT